MSADRQSWVVDIAEEDFERAVLQRSHELPVMVDFWSSSCSPCRILGPMLEALAAEKGGAFLLAKVNLDHCPNLAMQFGIEAVPTVQVFRNGKAAHGFVGLMPEEQLQAFVERICPTEMDKLVQQARKLETSAPPEAERLYQQVLAQEPDHGGALLGRVRLLLNRDEDAEAATLLGQLRVGEEMAEEAERLEHVLDLRRLALSFGTEAEARQRVEAEPKNAERRYELGCVQARAGRYAEALETLLSAAERNLALARGKVREAMVAIFHVIGERDPLADEYRKKLAQLLY